jgi:hypothetical protein
MGRSGARETSAPLPGSGAEDNDSDVEITEGKDGHGDAAKEGDESSEEAAFEEAAEEEEVLGTAPSSPAAPDAGIPGSGALRHKSEEDLARRLQVRAVLGVQRMQYSGQAQRAAGDGGRRG